MRQSKVEIRPGSKSWDLSGFQFAAGRPTILATVRPETPANFGQYGWLGTGQRSNDALAGLSLMGVRLYNSSTGRFLTRDPIHGGNDNSYVYPTDPIGSQDLTGEYECAKQCRDMQKTCQRYNSASRCYHLGSIIDRLATYSETLHKKYKSNQLNAARHFTMMIIIATFLGSARAALEIGEIHEAQSVHDTPVDTRRDRSNNRYAAAWFTTQTEDAYALVGGSLTHGDIARIHKVGLSHYNRGWMYSQCNKRIVRGVC